MKRCVMITGAAGFIGSNLATRLLDAGYQVRGIDNLSAGTIDNVDPRVDFCRIDIREPGIYPLFKGAAAVFHLAAKTCLPECVKNPIDTASLNVLGTVNVLEAARMADVKKFIFADTSAEYEGIHEFPSSENQVRPIGIYAASKHGATAFCDSYRELYGLATVILRYFNVYGPAQDWRRVIPPVMSSFILKMLQGDRPVIYGSGEKRRDFVYVDDVNDFHLLALEDERANGRVFNVGSGANHSVNEVYQMIEALLQTQLAPIHQPELPGEAQITLADITAARSLGWMPKVSVQDGLIRTIDYLKARMDGASINVPAD